LTPCRSPSVNASKRGGSRPIHPSLSPAVNTERSYWADSFFMLQLGGIVVLFGCVFGGYLMTGGSLGVIFEALPHEILTIFGAAIAAMLIAGSMYNMKKILGSLGKVISGPSWKPKDYSDLLCLLFLLTKTMKSKGLIALEAHIEKPDDSSIFKRYPKICKDHFALDFICDTLRMMTMSLEDPHQVETAMEKQLEK